MEEILASIRRIIADDEAKPATAEKPSNPAPPAKPGEGVIDQVKLESLETDAQAAQSVYESFLQRYHEVARQGSIAGVGARILSPARAPGMPTSPHILFNGAITLEGA